MQNLLGLSAWESAIYILQAKHRITVQSWHFWSVKPQLIPASPAEILNIRELAVDIWNEYYPAIIGAEQVEYMLGKLYSEAALLDQMHKGQAFWLIRLEDIVCGFAAVSKEAEGRYFLNKFYIQQHSRAKGLGLAVFRELLNLYPDLQEMRLQVNRQNVVAINFYFKAGFVIEKSADFDIGDGYFMNDFVMVYKVK